MSQILFVCMGNICRSPMAEGAFARAVIEYNKENVANPISLGIDSAATTSYHIDSPPDPRACETALAKGVDISAQKARQVEVDDFDKFDYILAMDRSNLEDLISIAPNHSKAEVALLLDYSLNPNAEEVPDPYFGGEEGFYKCFDLIDDGARGLLRFITTTSED